MEHTKLQLFLASMALIGIIGLLFCALAFVWWLCVNVSVVGGIAVGSAILIAVAVIGLVLTVK